MKLGVHGPNRRTTCPLAKIVRKSIVTAESQFSWNSVLTAQIDAEVVPELRSWKNQFFRQNRNFHEIGCSRPKSAHKRSPSSDQEKINFYGRIAIFMKLGAHCPNRRKSLPSSDHEKINFYGRIAIFMKLGAHCPNRRKSLNPELRFMRKFSIGCFLAQIMRKSIFRIAIFMKLGAYGPNRRTSGPRAQIMRKSIFTAESQFSWNWVLTAQIHEEAVPELRSWENQFLLANGNFHEIGCSRPKSTEKLSPSSDHEKINFYGRIAIFMKLGAHGPNRRTSGSRAQIMRKSIFTAESQFSWNWVLTGQIDAQAVSELRSWENQFLRPNRNFHEIGCSRPKSAQKLARAQIMRKSIFTIESQFSWNWVLTAQIGAKACPSADHEKINFYGRIAIFMKLGAHTQNRRTSCSWAQIMRKSIFTAELQFSWNWVVTTQIDAEAVPELRSWENQFLWPNLNFHEKCSSRPKSAHKRSPSSDHEKINFYGRIAIFMKLGAHGPNGRRSAFRGEIMAKCFFYGRIAIFMILGAHLPNWGTVASRPELKRKCIFPAESEFFLNSVPTSQIGA